MSDRGPNLGGMNAAVAQRLADNPRGILLQQGHEQIVQAQLLVAGGDRRPLGRMKVLPTRFIEFPNHRRIATVSTRAATVVVNFELLPEAANKLAAEKAHRQLSEAAEHLPARDLVERRARRARKSFIASRYGDAGATEVRMTLCPLRCKFGYRDRYAPIAGEYRIGVRVRGGPLLRPNVRARHVVVNLSSYTEPAAPRPARC